MLIIICAFSSITRILRSAVVSLVNSATHHPFSFGSAPIGAMYMHLVSRVSGYFSSILSTANSAQIFFPLPIGSAMSTLSACYLIHIQHAGDKPFEQASSPHRLSRYRMDQICVVLHIWHSRRRYASTWPRPRS